MYVATHAGCSFCAARSVMKIQILFIRFKKVRKACVPTNSICFAS